MRGRAKCLLAKLVSIRRLLGVVAIAFLFAPAGFVAQGELMAADRTQQAEMSEEALRAKAIREMPGASAMMRVIKEHYPDNFEEMVRIQIDGEKNGVDYETLFNKSAEYAANLRQQVAGHFLKAPIATHREFIGGLVPILDYLQSKYGTDACNKMAAGGGAAVAQSIGVKTFGRDFALLAKMDRLGAIVMRGAAEAKHISAEPQSPSFEDWSLTVEQLRADGMQESELDLVLNIDRQAMIENPKFCDAAKKWLTGIAGLEGEEANRVIPKVAMGVVGG